MKKISPPAPAGARRPRGRPRSFDREAALDAAMEVFWEKGYEGASISDLTGAMGVNPPSLYAAFGDKEKLFLAAVERYLQVRRDSCPYCEEATARESIGRLLTYSAEELSESGHPRGCLMMMASATVANASQALQKAIAGHRAWGRERMRERIRQGIAEGDVPQGTDAAALADFYMAVLAGIAAQAREGTTRKSLLGIVERAMELFPKPPRAPAKKRARRETAAA